MSIEVRNIIDNNRATNPEYEYKFYNAIERSEYFNQNCPEYFSSYEAVIPGSYKSDLFRYCFLYTEGGIYIDDKISVLKPFKEWVTDGIIFFKCAGSDDGIITGFIHSPLPKHPILEYLRESMV
jgi:mannosyltransferase OCH1-like enzyme